MIGWSHWWEEIYWLLHFQPQGYIHTPPSSINLQVPTTESIDIWPISPPTSFLWQLHRHHITTSLYTPGFWTSSGSVHCCSGLFQLSKELHQIQYNSSNLYHIMEQSTKTNNSSEEDKSIHLPLKALRSLLTINHLCVPAQQSLIWVTAQALHDCLVYCGINNSLIVNDGKYAIKNVNNGLMFLDSREYKRMPYITDHSCISMIKAFLMTNASPLVGGQSVYVSYLMINIVLPKKMMHQSTYIISTMHDKFVKKNVPKKATEEDRSIPE